MIKIIGVALLILFVGIIFSFGMEFLKYWLVNIYGNNIALTVFIILDVILAIVAAKTILNN